MEYSVASTRKLIPNKILVSRVVTHRIHAVLEQFSGNQLGLEHIEKVEVTMSKIKDLAKFSIEELKEFFASFDVVFSDIDGERQSFVERSIASF